MVLPSRLDALLDFQMSLGSANFQVYLGVVAPLSHPSPLVCAGLLGPQKTLGSVDLQVHVGDLLPLSCAGVWVLLVSANV